MKTLKLLAIAFAFVSLVACGGAQTEATEEPVAVEETVVEQAVVVDTTNAQTPAAETPATEVVNQ